jgi:hypothetical protein
MVAAVTAFSNQTILDDVYWLEATMRMKRGEFDEALKLSIANYAGVSGRHSQ